MRLFLKLRRRDLNVRMLSIGVKLMKKITLMLPSSLRDSKLRKKL
jgi:hypothetical protein